MAFDYSKLRGRIVEKDNSQTAFTKAFGVSENTLSLKLNNKIRFTTDDIIKISKILEIPKNEIGQYFFTPEV